MWIKIGDRRINTANIALYGADENGDSYIIWAAGHRTKYQGRGVVEAIDKILNPIKPSGRALPVIGGPAPVLPPAIQMAARTRTSGGEHR